MHFIARAAKPTRGSGPINNEWANFGRKDFEPVVTAFKELLECFRCESCESGLHITPRANPESLRCACNAVNFKFKTKPK
jgi:hypothetical protein